MAADITASLRAIDPVDPIKFDFSICHLGMMNACGFGKKTGDYPLPAQRRLSLADSQARARSAELEEGTQAGSEL